MTRLRPTIFSAACFALLLMCGAARAEAPASPPAGRHTDEERAALKDLQAVLETMAADGAEDRRNREQAFKTLARVREALKSWDRSGDYYRKLLTRGSSDEVAYYVLSGLAISAKAEHGHARGVIAALTKDEAEAGAARSGEVRNQRHKILDRVKKTADAFGKLAGYGGPRLRPMKGVRQKEPSDPFMLITPPKWMEPPAPKPAPKGKGKGKGKEKEPPAADPSERPATSIPFRDEYK